MHGGVHRSVKIMRTRASVNLAPLNLRAVVSKIGIGDEHSLGNLCPWLEGIARKWHGVGGQRPVDTESGTGETQRISCDPGHCRGHSLFLEVKEGKSGLSFDKLSKTRKYGRSPQPSL